MKVLFVGPSLHGQREHLASLHPDFELRPPAIRGDVAMAVVDGATAIGLVDGCFGASQSVWHKEILFALERGVPVGGGASMGALRAAECDAFGMQGVGGIYDDYKSGRLSDDEEVCLSHGPAEIDWLPLSVPWVNFSATIVEAAVRGDVTPDERDLLMIAGHRLHYTERTFRRALQMAEAISERRRCDVLERLQATVRDRKREDAWRVARWLSSTSGPLHVPWTLSRTSHWQSLEQDLERIHGFRAGRFADRGQQNMAVKACVRGGTARRSPASPRPEEVSRTWVTTDTPRTG
ncbi:TfuA-like protein [Aureimonas ureilytica]|uniref:TfuA-like protein n=1 Tax=Aureimonas ureilytica TaxID=401562 RepID=UPI000380F4AE|nr:TfuA-like protein [Aureimonas ureilytica]